MASAFMMGLAVLSASNSGNTFEFSGFDSSIKPTTKPFAIPTIKPFSSTTAQAKLADPSTTKSSAFGAVAPPKPFGAPFDPFRQAPKPFGAAPFDPFRQAPKPFGAGPFDPFRQAPKPFGAAPFDPFKQAAYQPYQPAGQFRAGYQPFGPYPGYPGPVVYPGQFGGGYQPTAFAQQQQPFPGFGKPFGSQPLAPAPTVPAAFGSFKFGAPPKKFNKNADSVPQPGKYFQEHQFGAYHGPEFSSAVVPAEHSFKQSVPKDVLFNGGGPVVPKLPEFGLTKAVFGGFAPQPQPFAGYQLPKFPQIQPFVSTLSPVNNFVTDSPAAVDVSSVATTLVQDESATLARFGSEEVTPSQTPAADPQPTGPSQEEASTSAAVVADNEVPVADVQQSEQSTAATAEVGEPDATTAAANAADSGNDSAAVQEAVNPSSSPIVVEDVSVPTGASEETSGKPEEVKPTESAVPVAANLPGKPNEFYAAGGPLSASDPSFASGIFGSAEFPGFFGQSGVDFQQQYVPSFYDSPKFTEEELKLFAANFQNSGIEASQIFGIADPAVKITQGAVSTESNTLVSSTPSAVESAEKVEINENASSDKKTEESGEKKEGDSESRNIPEVPKKSNTVQIIQDDVFNGQLPVLYDPSNSGAPLDSYRFYSNPIVSDLSSKASLASYSPEQAFATFGSQFHNSYLVGGSSSLTPIGKTVVKSSHIPISISSADHPLHSQVFKYSQSFVPYPQVVNSNTPAAFRSIELPSTASPVAADSVSSTKSEATIVESSTETA